MGTRKATLIRNSGPGRDGRFLAFVMRRLPKDSDRETLNSNKSCLRIAREFIPRLDVAAETMIERIDPPAPGGPPYSGRSEERRVGKECRSRWWANHTN